MDKSKAFFALVRAGLWEKEVRLAPYGEIDYAEVLRMAEVQSVVGLVAAGIEHIVDVRPQKKDVLQFIGRVTQVEQQNTAMNYFIGVMMDKMREAGIYSVLVKGQGVAQCYERPLWRACGDVDLLLDAENYERAKAFLIPLASNVETEFTHFKHLGMTIDPWVVELHGTMHSRLSRRIDAELDWIQEECLRDGKVRAWRDGETDVFLPAPDEDVIFVFTHILHHFFLEGIGLRQICDWCRLLWTYRDSLDYELLESRIRKAGLMSEWKAFAAFAVEYLGMPLESMPLFNVNDNQNANLKSKADRIMAFVLEVGNFGHNKVDQSTGGKAKVYFWRKFVSFWGRLSDMLRHFRIFPLDSIRFFSGVLRSGLHAAVRGE